MKRTGVHRRQPAPVLSDAVRLFAELKHEGAVKTDERQTR